MLLVLWLGRDVLILGWFGFVLLLLLFWTFCWGGIQEWLVSFAGLFAACRCSATSCKAGALSAAVVTLQTLGSQRAVGLGHQQHRVLGVGETLGSQGCGMCVAGGVQGQDVALGPWRFWYAAHTQEVWPPWLQTYIYLEMYSEISASFLIWFGLIWGEENHWSRGVGGFVWFPSQQKLKAIYSSHLAVLVVTRRRHLKVSGHVLPLGTEGAGFAFVQLQRWMSSPI